jgi:hypothetical protein
VGTPLRVVVMRSKDDAVARGETHTAL